MPKDDASRMTPTNDALVTVEEAATDAAFRAIHGPDADPFASPESWDFAATVADAVRHRLAALASAPAGDVIAAVRGITDDYMTSETHHPGYVLIPAARFDKLREAEALLESAPAGDGVEDQDDYGDFDASACISRHTTMYGEVQMHRVANSAFAQGKAAALARPRAAVGEREAAFDPVAYGARVLATMGDQSCRPVAAAIGISPATLNRVTRGGMPDVPTLYAIDHWLALQSPPAKVEG